MNRLADLIPAAQALGISGMAITDHDNLCGVIDINLMQKKLRKEGSDFTLAIGNEIYLLDSFDPEDKSRRPYFHFILIAKDKIGYQAIVELSSRAWYRAAVKYGRWRVVTLKSDIEELLETAKGHLIATTACLGGELNFWVKNKDIEEAQKFVDWGKQVFGEDDFYVEIQPSRQPDQKRFNQAALHFNCQNIIATDAHYQSKEDYHIFEAFLRSERKSQNREVKEYYEYARLMGEAEIYEILTEQGLTAEQIEAGLESTRKIERQIEFYDLEQESRIPKVELPSVPLKITPQQRIELSAYPTIDWALQDQDYQTVYCARYCLNSLDERGLWNQHYLKRLEEEFRVFKFQSESLHDNFYAYPNTMQHFIELAWSIDCAVGPSRGSASGSLLCYLMDVIQCDPIQYDLYFWRFLNETRVTPLERRASELNLLKGVA